ncbi:UTP--glucose-1-phosphate uridylyltransferase [Grifola frondosa]|uniref:UTP--glucose-1-phosphate uridylyltransferase n=1 Tax=Grifola frondosa TaxID=5627 RepID=A0A1C7M354_GRIFR|nr:UTP--glucose-1-phosphate uridylyltransferase [Grifola frondosa]QFX67704.1 putative UDP-glucose pyrophosphorylase [Grifola frondosa]
MSQGTSDIEITWTSLMKELMIPPPRPLDTRHDSAASLEISKMIHEAQEQMKNHGAGINQDVSQENSEHVVLPSAKVKEAGAKSALEVKDDITFLDLTVRQIEHLHTTHRVDVPLILMTSFNTHEDTLRVIKKYANQQLHITTFNQSRYPCINKKTLLPAPKSVNDEKTKWYPPGHGDLYNALLHSGVLHSGMLDQRRARSTSSCPTPTYKNQ